MNRKAIIAIIASIGMIISNPLSVMAEDTVPFIGETAINMKVSGTYTIEIPYKLPCSFTEGSDSACLYTDVAPIVVWDGLIKPDADVAVEFSITNAFDVNTTTGLSSDAKTIRMIQREYNPTNASQLENYDFSSSTNRKLLYIFTEIPSSYNYATSDYAVMSLDRDRYSRTIYPQQYSLHYNCGYNAASPSSSLKDAFAYGATWKGTSAITIRQVKLSEISL